MNDRTEKGDEYREKMAEQADALDKRVAEQEKEIADERKGIDDLEKKSEHLMKKASIQGKIALNADVAVEAANVSAATTDKAASKALTDEEAKLADARRAKQLLSEQKADVKKRIESEEARKADAGRSEYEAQLKYDRSRVDGSNRTQQVAAFNALQDAKKSAQNVNFAADSAINSLKKTLDSIETRLKAASSYLESKFKQQRNFMSEAPAGE